MLSSETFCIALIRLRACAGNDNIHLMTYDKRQKLRIEMYDWEGRKYTVDYDNFKVDSEHSMYKLSSLGTCSGNAGQYDTKTDLIL